MTVSKCQYSLAGVVQQIGSALMFIEKRYRAVSVLIAFRAIFEKYIA